jgi:hypothetical protein
VTRGRLLALAFACIAVAVFAVRPRPTPGPMLRDFEAYWAAGRTLNAHADPYGRAIWNAELAVAGVDARREEILPFVGPPATLLVWSGLARLNYGGAALTWSGILATFLLALVAAPLRASGELALAPFLAALALALAFGPVTSDLALGQVALASFAAATLVAALRARSLPFATAAACIAFAQPNVSLGLVSQLGRNRQTFAIVLGALAAYLLGALAAGWAWPSAYARVLFAHAAAERFVAIQVSPASIAFGFGATLVAARVAAAVVAVLAIGAALAIALRVRQPFARFAAFCALAPLAVGFFHEHDLIVAYAAAVWCALRTCATTRLIALAGTLLVAVDWLGLAQRPTGIVQSALLAAAVFAAFAALGDEVDPRGTLAVAIPFAALFSAAALLATRNPAPIWPDALGLFHAAPGESIAAVWTGEQRASGLLAGVPAWALLRSLSLLGCALLACAIYRHSIYRRTA